MDKVHRQHGSIVLYEEKKDGEQYIRIAYADNPLHVLSIKVLLFWI